MATNAATISLVRPRVAEDSRAAGSGLPAVSGCAPYSALSCAVYEALDPKPYSVLGGGADGGADGL